eukprot:GFUD01111939.1.p1 GENE.GFUD01111939.1~~GFUD01111939.1.p1  ORF type:complete len:215 (+),score=80.82 GFUD01111939.1:185-829(+)
MEEHSELDMEDHPELDEETMATLKRIHIELELEDAVEEEINWQDVKPMAVDPVELIVARVNSLKNKIYKKFKKSKAAVQDIIPESKSGCELTGELEEAWNLYTRGMDQIPSRSVGYVLRILGQNPTEDDIVEMVMKANCDWEGLMSRQDFIGVGMEILKSSCNQMDDVKAAFRVFDHNNDGTISKEELKEGMVDFDEFVMMMMPSTAAAAGGIM